ncbi:MAG: ATP-dependent DNA helicase RecG [Planctomycetota bacterium]
MANLDTDIQFVKGVGPARSEVLRALGITNIRSLLYFVPRGAGRYIFYRGFQSIAECRDGDEVIVKGTVTKAALRWTRGRRQLFEAALTDDTGTLWGVWFNVRSYLTETVKEGAVLIFRGKVSLRERLQITHPQCEAVTEGTVAEIDEYIAKGTVLPLYPETAAFHEHVGQAVIRKVIRNAWEEVHDALVDPLPAEVLKTRNLCGLQEMFRFLHFPETRAEIDAGIQRYKFQEFFAMELGIARYAHQLRAGLRKAPVEITPHITARIRRRFPFTFTAAQERVVGEITRDMTAPAPMNRLLQGDVGSGKTAVAVYAILAVVANRRQAAFMAPTGILAEQHFRTFDRMLGDSQVRYALLTGGLPAAERAALLARIAAGEVDVVIGTHALIQKDVSFKDLAFVIVDEQHKFGVLQRRDLTDKGYNPDVLLMTATPIPRTLSMTAYGEYDISVIDEMPPGRIPVKTCWFTEENREQGYAIIRDRAAKGEQVFVVCPLVEGSEDSDLKSAVETHVLLGTRVFPGLTVGLLHGRMKDAEKEAIMRRFHDGDIRILVSTVVIEVGVDVPNATVMVVEHAERFGLAQLHQLRGRIGRGTERSICLLFATCTTEEGRQRIGILTETNDGFKIAERDFELRGPGDYFGTRQHGIPDFYLADLREDRLLLYGAREDAFRIVGVDPELKDERHRHLEDLIRRKFQYGVELLGVT